LAWFECGGAAGSQLSVPANACIWTPAEARSASTARRSACGPSQCISARSGAAYGQPDDRAVQGQRLRLLGCSLIVLQLGGDTPQRALPGPAVEPHV